ncbi:MAG: Lrp/AsnC ligand binding domain-containing protein [Anaerolineae bacterium]
MADSIAYVMIGTEVGAAARVAQTVAQVDGVHWTATVTGQYDVIAAVRVADNTALADLIDEGINVVPGIGMTSTAVALRWFGPDGKPAQDGPPPP